MNTFNGIDPETGKRIEDLTDDEFIDCLGTANCRDCKKRIDETCERLKKIELARPWFTSQESAVGYPCRDYEPSEWRVILKKYWRGTDIYVRYYSKSLYIPVCEIGNQSVRYFINFWDFYNGTMFDGNGLKWIYKKYYRRSRKSQTGYELVTEYREKNSGTLWGKDG